MIYIFYCAQNKDVFSGVKFMCRMHKVLAVVFRSVVSQSDNAISLIFEGRSLGKGDVSVATADQAITTC